MGLFFNQKIQDLWNFIFFLDPLPPPPPPPIIIAYDTANILGHIL